MILELMEDRGKYGHLKSSLGANQLIDELTTWFPFVKHKKIQYQNRVILEFF